MLQSVKGIITTPRFIPAEPDLYAVHPFLDPKLARRRPALARLWLDNYRRAVKDPSYYRTLLRIHGERGGNEEATADLLKRYYRDADAYLDDLLRLVPESLADQMRPLPETRRLEEMLGLLRNAFEQKDPRRRYEAQRKLCLADLLFDVDHCRTVQDGPRHKNRFEAILLDSLWCDLTGGRQVEVSCRFPEGEAGKEHLIIGDSNGKDAVCWRFQVRKLPAANGDREIVIYHYRSRFKKEANPELSRTTTNGFLRLSEQPRWPGLGRRSGSIVSKMLRRGIGDPKMVEDLLGAMFIVGDREQAYALERRLLHILGGPLRWRDRVDTLGGEEERGSLNKRSSVGFRVLKGIVDILNEDRSGAAPYFFSVEVQIFPLEAYLRTLHDEHFASHYAYKKRQFLHDLLPMLFPSEIFGKETAHLAAESR